MSAKFKRIDESYRSDAIETHNQLNLITLERSENERLLQLYRTQNEILDTQNRQYTDNLGDIEASLK